MNEGKRLETLAPLACFPFLTGGGVGSSAKNRCVITLLRFLSCVLVSNNTNAQQASTAPLLPTFRIVPLGLTLTPPLSSLLPLIHSLFFSHKPYAPCPPAGHGRHSVPRGRTAHSASKRKCTQAGICVCSPPSSPTTSFSAHPNPQPLSSSGHRFAAHRSTARRSAMPRARRLGEQQRSDLSVIAL